MKTIALLTPLLALAALSPAPASAEKLGEHPAIIAARVYAAQGYDYAAKFYPHPARLVLLPQAPAEATATARPAPDDKPVVALRRDPQSTR